MLGIVRTVAWPAHCAARTAWSQSESRQSYHPTPLHPTAAPSDRRLTHVQEELERRYQAPVKLGGIERRIAYRLRYELPKFHAGGGIGVARPEAGWRLG